MKFTTIPFILIIMTVVGVGMAGIYNTAASNVNKEKTTIGDDYNRLGAVYGDYSDIENDINDVTATSSTDSNFLTDVSTMWKTTKGIFTMTSQLTNVTSMASNNSEAGGLGFPSYLRWALLAVVVVSLMGLIISIAVRWKTD